MGPIMKSHIHLFCGYFYLLLCIQRCLSKLTLDMESYDCTHQEPSFISDDELVSIIARPRMDIPTRTHCTIALKASTNRYFNIYIQDINIRDCGVKLEFFDNDIFLKNPFKTFGCQSSPGAFFSTYTNLLTIKLIKTSSAATIYRIQIELATNKGPKVRAAGRNNHTKTSLTITTLCVALLFSWLL